MADYVAPLKEMEFVLREVVGLQQVRSLPGYEEADDDLASAILEEAGKFAGEVLSPLNRIGDQVGARCENHAVTMPPGFKEAFAQFIEAGWMGLNHNPEFGGQGLPHLLGAPVAEMWKSACMAFALAPMLTQGAAEAIDHHASDELKARYLPKMLTGEWPGTMNLTEPQAGSDLAAVRSKAIPEGNGYRISGTKIFITYGDHDLTENIIHLVLARLPDAPAGVKGISLFLVPKFHVNEDGSLGEANDVKCVSIEHKTGIHASPTAVMAFGEKEGALGYLVGEPHQGLAYMFTMMNHARLGVGLEGLAQSEGAWQKAYAYATDRVQGKVVGREGKLPIAYHPDVRRMLMDMRSRTEAMRVLAYQAASDIDVASRHPDEAVRTQAQQRVDLLTPVVKGWCTEQANEITWLGVQVHGGMGYIEETGAAQLMRDARITTIYEGTTGIQAADLMGRKTARDQGRAMAELIVEMEAVANSASNAPELSALGQALTVAIGHLKQATEYLCAHFETQSAGLLFSSVAFLNLTGVVLGGWSITRAALAAKRMLPDAPQDETFLQQKMATARYYGLQTLPLAESLMNQVLAGVESLAAADAALG
jgi:alkylation response protein AidB-like acyl-CoA dehydrogenase